MEGRETVQIRNRDKLARRLLLEVRRTRGGKNYDLKKTFNLVSLDVIMVKLGKCSLDYFTV